MTSKASIYIVANSVFPYRYDVVKVLSLPNKSFYRARFDEIFVSNQIKRDHSSLRNHRGYYCFRDFETGNITPIRSIIIDEIKLIGSIYYIGYFISDIIDFPQSDDLVEEQLKNFRSTFLSLNKFSETGPRSHMKPLVILSKAKVEISSEVESLSSDFDVQTRRWSAITKYLGKYPYFKYTPFFRIVGIREIGNQRFQDFFDSAPIYSGKDYQLQLVHLLRHDSSHPHDIEKEATERSEIYLNRASYKLKATSDSIYVFPNKEEIVVTGSYDVNFFSFRTGDTPEKRPVHINIDYLNTPPHLSGLDTSIHFSITLYPSKKISFVKIFLMVVFITVYMSPTVFPSVAQYLSFDDRILKDISIVAFAITAFDFINEIRRYLAGKS